MGIGRPRCESGPPETKGRPGPGLQGGCSVHKPSFNQLSAVLKERPMMCEKCKAQPATVHITQQVPGGTGEVPPSEATHHFCEGCGREFMLTSPDFRAASFSGPGPATRIELVHASPGPNPPPTQAQIDISKRFDVYCIEPNRGIVVYRNALFKGAAVLFPAAGGRTFHPDYVELEQANGQSIFFTRSSIVRFCEPGTTLVAEVVTSNPSDVR